MLWFPEECQKFQTKKCGISPAATTLRELLYCNFLPCLILYTLLSTVIECQKSNILKGCVKRIPKNFILQKKNKTEEKHLQELLRYILWPKIELDSNPSQTTLQREKREIVYIFYRVQSADIHLCSGFHTVRKEGPSDLGRFQPFSPVVTGLTFVTRTRPF